MFDFKQNPPLSLYIHFPWCLQKCPYCDFNSHAIAAGEAPESAYIDALIRDLEFELPRIWGRRVISVFIGGGTPSLLSAEALDRLMSVLRSHLNIPSEIEITLEANPGAAEADRFAAYRQMGINRLSIGVQSFADEKLKRLGRIHDGDNAVNAIVMAQAAGFENINVDLMFGLPDQTQAEAISDLHIALEHKPSHISWYQLTIEPNTVFYKQPPVLPDDDDIWAMQQQGKVLLQESAFKQYEVSAYALAKKQSVHNTNYWQFGDYLGIGAGAHGKLTDVANGVICRFVRHRIPDSYMQKAGDEQVITQQTSLSRADVSLEFMMNALRLTEGIDTALFLQRTGLPISVIDAQLKDAEESGLLEWDINKLKATATGQRYLNDLLQLFMPSESKQAREL